MPKKAAAAAFFTVDIYPHRVYNIHKRGDSMEKEKSLLKKECMCHEKKTRSDAEHKKLVNRLNRIEGQIRGIRSMLENDAYCIDILLQVSAAGAALNSFSKEILAQHIKTCVAEDIKAGNDEITDELVKTLYKLMK